MEEELKKGELWRNNRRGFVYEVVALPLWSDTPNVHPDEGIDGLEQWVVLRNIETGVEYTRSMQSFRGTNRDGQPRFECVRRK